MGNEKVIILMPAQLRALQELREALPAGDVFVLKCASGAGRTAVLRELQAAEGGILIGIREFVRSMSGRDLFAMEEALLDEIDRALRAHDLVIVDDLHLVSQVVNRWQAARSHLLDALLTAILDEAAACRKKLVFGVEEQAPWPVQRRAHEFEMDDFAEEDVAVLYGDAVKVGFGVD